MNKMIGTVILYLLSAITLHPKLSEETIVKNVTYGRWGSFFLF